METARLRSGVRTFYAATVDGKRVLLYAAVGACAVVAIALLLQPEHAAAAGKVGKTARFVGKEIARSGVGKKIVHHAHLVLRNGQDTVLPNGQHISHFQYRTFLPGHHAPAGDLGDAVREYLRIYGDFGRGVLRIIKRIGHARLGGQFPWPPPGTPGVGSGGAGVPF